MLSTHPVCLLVGAFNPFTFKVIINMCDPITILLICVQLFVTPCNAARQASLSITNSWSLLKLRSIASVMPSNRLIFCHPLFLLPSIFPSIRVFANESVLHIRWPEYWCFSFSISPSNEYSGLIFFRIDWLDLLAGQGTHESSPAPQFKNINSLALSLLYGPTLTSILPMVTRKTIVLTRQTFVGKLMSLLFNMLSRLVIAFLPRSKHPLISWLQSPSTVNCFGFIFYRSYCSFVFPA